jgi:hypothetical protein
MATDANEDVIRAVTCAIQARPGLNMDDVILSCRPHTWNQVFLALDALIRVGVVRIRPHGGFYTISPSFKRIAGRHQNRSKKPTVKGDINPYRQISRDVSISQSLNQAGNPLMR